MWGFHILISYIQTLFIFRVFFHEWFFLSEWCLSSGQQYVFQHLFPSPQSCSEANKLVNNLPPGFLAGSFEPGDDGSNRGHAFWPRPSPPYLSYNVLIVETDWLAGSAALLGLWGPWQASHSCLVNRSNCSERGARVKALEHQAFGKEKPWRHDWVSNQREAEKGWGKCSAGWMKELSVKYALNDI